MAILKRRFAECLLRESDAGIVSQLFDSGLFHSARRRPSFRPSMLVAATILALLSARAPAAHAQDASQSSSQTAIYAHPAEPIGTNRRSEDGQDGMSPQVNQHMLARLNQDRQKALVADTNKLLVLAQELQAEVDRSSKDQLSLGVVKKAEEIEKLARSVKEKMRGN